LRQDRNIAATTLDGKERMAGHFTNFSGKCTTYLADPAANNNKEWFDAHQKDYEAWVREPMLAFVREMGERFQRFAPRITADDRKSGGSMMRIFRDTRFSKDKTPYNTHATCRFFHEVGKKVAAPGFYFRITATDVALGAGIWHPETKITNGIREHIVENDKAWVKARDDKAFVRAFGALQGESLKRPPRGFDADHPFVEDLKRKDFVAFAEWKPSSITKKDFADRVEAAWETSTPLMKFLCDAVGVTW